MMERIHINPKSVRSQTVPYMGLPLFNHQPLNYSTESKIWEVIFPYV